MSDKFDIGVESEIGRLKGVILHSPGQEVANMTPETAERALYSDILNLSVAQRGVSATSGGARENEPGFSDPRPSDGGSGQQPGARGPGEADLRGRERTRNRR